MEVETTIAESIRAMDKHAQYDAACKRLLAIKIILAWIMKSCLTEFQHFDVNEIAAKYIEGDPVISKVAVAPDETNADLKIHGIGTEDSSLTEGKIYYDIRFIAVVPVSGERIRLIINLEAQGDFYPGYPITSRGVFYCCRLVSSQYGTEFTKSNYQDIKKVYSIWIALKPPKARETTITRYRIVEENVVGEVKEPIQHYDLMTLLVICLGKPEDTDCDILKLLDVLLSNEIEAVEKQQILQEQFQIPMTRELEEGISDMSNLGKVIEREGMAKGRAEGMAKGRVEGMTERTLSNLQNLMKNTGWPLEQAMTTLGVPKEEWGHYTKLLSK